MLKCLRHRCQLDAMWLILVTGLLTIDTSAYAPIQWMKFPQKGLALQIGRGSGLPKKLMIGDAADIDASGTAPYFTARPDHTIAWNGWCVESFDEGKTGNVVAVSRCTAAPSQQWTFLPDGHGRSMIQLRGTQKCLDVLESGLRGASIALRDCERKATGMWKLQGPALSIAESRLLSSRLIRDMTILSVALAMLGALSFKAWQRRVGLVSQGVVPVDARECGLVSRHDNGIRCPDVSMTVATEAAPVTAVVPAVEVAKLFGRFAEKEIYLDKEVGGCCYSACTDCEWRLPDGGYRFDVIRAARPKWIPCYLSREYKIGSGGSHVPLWVAALFPDGVSSQSPISRSDFEARVRELTYSAPMGPKGRVSASDSIPSAEALSFLWSWFSGGPDAPPADELTPTAILQRMQDMSLDENREGAIGEGPDSVDWKGFAKTFGVEPLERW